MSISFENSVLSFLINLFVFLFVFLSFYLSLHLSCYISLSFLLMSGILPSIFLMKKKLASFSTASCICSHSICSIKFASISSVSVLFILSCVLSAPFSCTFVNFSRVQKNIFKTILILAKPIVKNL